MEARAALGNLMQDGHDKLLIVTLPWLVRIVQGTRAAPAVHSLQLAEYLDSLRVTEKAIQQQLWPDT